MKATNTKNGGKEGKYLTFKLGREEYGLELVRVREIIALMDITPVPLAPEYVRGVMNLRGRVIPVVDLRRKFGMQPTEDHDRKCIIVCDVQRNEQPIQMSILVDAVSEVLHIGAADIEDAPSFSARGRDPSRTSPQPLGLTRRSWCTRAGRGVPRSGVIRTTPRRPLGSRVRAPPAGARRPPGRTGHAARRRGRGAVGGRPPR